MRRKKFADDMQMVSFETTADNVTFCSVVQSPDFDPATFTIRALATAGACCAKEYSREMKSIELAQFDEVAVT